MAFGKKVQSVGHFDQSNVSTLASAALAERRSMLVRLAFRAVGETPLLMNRWSQKAIMQMLGKMVGQPQPRDPKDLTSEFENSYYRNEREEIAIPCRIIKACIVNGAIMTNGVCSKAELKRGLRVMGYTAPLKGKNLKPQMDCRIVLNNGTPDVRSRAVIAAGYTFDFVVQFPVTLTPDKIVAALEGAGSAIGLCDWRPENGGDYGTFGVEVLPDSKIDEILEACSSPEVEYKIPQEFLRPFKGAPMPTSDSARKALAVMAKVNGDAKTKKNGKHEATT